MPKDLLTLPLVDRQLPGASSSHVALGPLAAASADDLADLYLVSYPSGVAAADLADAQQEIAATFRGEFGILRTDASATAWIDHHPVGAVMVVERSIWDEGLEGPFIIDLFVSPQARGRGVGRSLVQHAVQICALAGDAALSLRIGVGTSPAALAIYASLGFANSD